jgi:uncharacterized protein YjbI with pentapeptide repeats
MPRQRISIPRFGRGLIAVAGLMVTLAASPTVAQAPRDLAGPERIFRIPEVVSCPYCDLTGADASGQDLTNANLTGAILAGANFKGAILNGAVLIGANLAGANFENAKLNDSAKGHANLSRANLSGASFQGAELNGTDLQFARLDGADFSNLDLTRVTFGPRIKAGIAGSRKTSFRNARLPGKLALDAATTDVEGARWEPATAVPVAPEADDVVCGRADLSGLTSRIYVANTGTDNDTCGTSYSSPCKTIGFGIGRCAASGCGVLVAWDEYRPADTLALRDGVNVYGGCLPRSQSRPDYYSAVTAPDGGKPVASAPAINGGTILQAFQLNASVAAGTSAAISVALLVKDSSRLSVLDTELVANRGAQGTPGGHGSNGVAGGNGSGSNGGSVSACRNTGGGMGAVRRDIKVERKGLEGRCIPSCSAGNCFGFNGGPGTTGRGASGGRLGEDNCGFCAKNRGEKGKTGDLGANASCGAKGTASSSLAGSFSGDTWMASAGGAGTSGGDGGGGGGGGSGGYTGGICIDGKTQKPGNRGGGGGAGGCCGGAGGGGQQGGASFALLALRSTVSLTRSDIVAGTGGNGGNGGRGGRGSRGGTGAGGATNENGGFGGDGNRGGDGGAAGGAAGGNGGPAIGAALVGGSTIRDSDLAYYLGWSGAPGDGGAGGQAAVVGRACTAPPGDNGVNGLVADTKTF